MKILYISIVQHPLVGKPQGITTGNTPYYPSEVQL